MRLPADAARLGVRAISHRGVTYMMADGDGSLLVVPDGTVLDVHADAVDDMLYVERSGRRWACLPLAGIGARNRRASEASGSCKASCRRCRDQKTVRWGVDIIARQ